MPMPENGQFLNQRNRVCKCQRCGYHQPCCSVKVGAEALRDLPPQVFVFNFRRRREDFWL